MRSIDDRARLINVRIELFIIADSALLSPLYPVVTLPQKGLTREGGGGDGKEYFIFRPSVYVYRTGTYMNEMDCILDPFSTFIFA